MHVASAFYSDIELDYSMTSSDTVAPLFFVTTVVVVIVVTVVVVVVVVYGELVSVTVATSEIF